MRHRTNTNLPSAQCTYCKGLVHQAHSIGLIAHICKEEICTWVRTHYLWSGVLFKIVAYKSSRVTKVISNTSLQRQRVINMDLKPFVICMHLFAWICTNCAIKYVTEFTFIAVLHLYSKLKYWWSFHSYQNFTKYFALKDFIKCVNKKIQSSHIPL